MKIQSKRHRSVLVTGGAGYIGSHTVLGLLQSDFDVTVIDNLCNSSFDALERVHKLAGRRSRFIEGDIRDERLLRAIFADRSFDAVVHFAGLKSVGESVLRPLVYYDNNVAGTLCLCRVMSEANVFQLVFSSSATVYGEPAEMPVSEAFPTKAPKNSYGWSKLVAEQILQDLYRSNSSWRIGILRYFNPVGAHPSGLIGEDPNGIPSNLIPFMGQVALGKIERLSIFGDDYPTPDGTGIRDYIHVVDLARGHLQALDVLERESGLRIWNLGTGQGYSVLEVIRAFESASGRNIPYQIVPRREGDVAECWSDATKAFRELGWKAERGLDEMMVDAWGWQSQNPNGYPKL